MRLVFTIFFVGFSVFGTFTYSGTLLQEITCSNLLVVGLILSLFGLGTVFGGRIAPKLKKHLKNKFLILAGSLGFSSLLTLGTVNQLFLLCLSLFGFALAFIFMQSTLISTAQEKLPKLRGTTMSLASFNMFVGGAIGTSINGYIMKSYGTAQIFINASFIMLIIGIVSAVFIADFDRRKQQNFCKTSCKPWENSICYHGSECVL